MTARFELPRIPIPPSSKQSNAGMLPPLSDRMVSRKSMRLFDDLRAAAVLDAIEKDTASAGVGKTASGSFILGSANANTTSSTARATIKTVKSNGILPKVDSGLGSSRRQQPATTTTTTVTASSSKAVAAAPSSSSASSASSASSNIGMLSTINPSSSRTPRSQAVVPKVVASAPGSTRSAMQAAAKQQQQQLQPQPPSTARTAVSSTISSQQQQPPAPSATRRAMSPATAAREHCYELTSHELEEIQRYRSIYFVGQDSRRKHTSMFDDDNQDYRIVIGDHIAYRYEVVSMLGAGSFGKVVKALDHKTNHHVALKIIKNKRKFHEQAAIERDILQFVNEHSAGSGSSDVFVRMHDAFLFRNHVVMVFDLHGPSLYDRLKASNFQATPMWLLQGYARQMLTALQFTASRSIIHSDLKPENVLVTRGNPASIRVIDFGSSCFEHQRIHSYIQSRFYRAPEICLGIPYKPSIDTWSLGAMLYELWCGQPLFPAQSEAELMALITARVGSCPAHLVEKAPRRKHFYDGNGALKSAAKRASGSLAAAQRMGGIASQFGADQVELGHLITQMVRWNPAERISAEDALQHPFFAKQFAKPALQPTAPKHKRRYRVL